LPFGLELLVKIVQSSVLYLHQEQSGAGGV
jgi:hypothetical protein